MDSRIGKRTTMCCCEDVYQIEDEDDLEFIDELIEDDGRHFEYFETKEECKAKNCSCWQCFLPPKQ